MTNRTYYRCSGPIASRAGTPYNFFYYDGNRPRYLVDIPAEDRYLARISPSSRRYAEVKYGKLPVRPLPARPLVKPTRARKAAKPEPAAVSIINSLTLPLSFKRALAEVAADPQANDAINAMVERKEEFASPFAAVLAGAYLNETARDMIYTNGIGSSSIAPRRQRFVIIGGGVHAAIAASIIYRTYRKRAIVIDPAPLGGVFGFSRAPSFYLNSRNRPGPTGIPGDRLSSLNNLPGLLVQPADLSSSEYPSNDQMAWTIATTIAATASWVRDKVTFVRRGAYGGYSVGGSNYTFQATHVISATGIGAPTFPSTWQKSSRVMMFAEFMARMDTMFPLRGMRRVAVIGAGDSGKTAIEALTGLGPPQRMTVPSLDWIEQIDWFGVPDSCRTKEGWEASNRARYKQIGSLFAGDPPRVRARGKASTVSPGFDCVYVNEKPYDHAIVCVGATRGSSYSPPGTPDFIKRGGRVVASGRGAWVQVGPAADLGLTAGEQAVFGNISQNVVSMFRYGPRTAALAATLIDERL